MMILNAIADVHCESVGSSNVIIYQVCHLPLKQSLELMKCVLLISLSHGMLSTVAVHVEQCYIM